MRTGDLEFSENKRENEQILLQNQCSVCEVVKPPKSQSQSALTKPSRCRYGFWENNAVEAAQRTLLFAFPLCVCLISSVYREEFHESM